MKINRTNVLAIAIGMLLGISVGLSTQVYAERDNSQVAQASQQSSQQKIPLEDIQRFTTAMSQVKSYYVESVDDQELFENAIRGMLAGLDPHSAYLDKEEYKDLRDSTSGEFGGLGIEVSMDNGYVKVISPIDDTPASRAGLKPGDYIVRINDSPVKGMTLQDAVNKMRGKKGTDINILVIREGEKKPLKFKLTREIIVIKSVKSELLDDGYGYIRISHFQDPTVEDVEAAVKQLHKQSKGQLKGLVLDLRNNPGGLLDSAIDTSDVFLDSEEMGDNKMIVYTKGRLPSSQYKAIATEGDLMQGAPMVVIINEGSASASEIVAGALQDHKRALIIGTETFGKGSVQTVLPLAGERGIKLTTALYYTPNGRSIQAEGIQPDIIVKPVKLNKAENDIDSQLFDAIQEADLENHLDNGNGDKQAANDEDVIDKKALVDEDFQLFQALTLLKGMSLYQPN